MMETNKDADLETRIIEAARQLFIEKGFVETNMSDIAAKVGINRPSLHYYFRTKDKMYQAVFGTIIQSFVPKIHDVILQKEKSVAERVAGVVDAYYTVFSENPCLPLFMFREMHRDIHFLIHTITELQAGSYLKQIVGSLQEEMKQGNIRQVPLRVLFFTFYGLLAAPFVTKDLAPLVFLENGETFEDMLVKWKPYIVLQIENLLSV